MLSHSGFVLSILAGRTAGWANQQRDDHVLPLSFVMRLFALHTALGVTAAAVLYWYVPNSLGWFVPLLAGLVLAIPLVYLTSSAPLGRYARKLGLFRIPAEAGDVRIATRVHELAAVPAG
jgi:membrane glycosyltransferase